MIEPTPPAQADLQQTLLRRPLLIGAILTGCAACVSGLFLFGQPAGSGLMKTLNGSEAESLNALFTGGSLVADDAASSRTQRLAGVGAEASPSKIVSAAPDEIVGQNDKLAVELAAWEKLPAGACVTVVSKSGHHLSFRILGARPVPTEGLNGAGEKIELAVTPCAKEGEPIVKAIIEPDAKSARKQAAPERSL